MKHLARDSELADLRRQAQRLAQSRNERVTTLHLLASVADAEDVASGLLRDRRLTADDLLRAVRSTSDDAGDPLSFALGGAVQVAERMRAPAPNAAHLVIALLSNRQTAAYRALDQCGVDVRRLRLAAMNRALGLLGRTPLPSRTGSTASVTATASRAEAPRRTRSSPPRRRARVVGPEDQRKARARAAERAARARRPEEADLPAPAPESAAPAVVEPLSSDEERFELPTKAFPLLSRLGKNLTLAAVKGQLDRLVCRDAEVDQVLDVMAKRLANNPCLVGPSGVGKTQIVHGVAQRLAERGLLDGETTACRIVVEVSPGSLISGTGVRGGLAERIQALLKELEAAAGRVVVFFDEIHQLFVGDGGDEMASEFKLALARGRLPCIGATTPEEYARAVEVDGALSRRFSVVEIEEPTREEAFMVLSSLAPRFEAHHGIRYGEDALALAIAWSVQYVPGRALPDKAVSVVDLSGARARRRGHDRVDREQVAEVVSEMAGVPVERLLQTDGQRALALEATLAERVVGHGPCLTAIARAVRRNAAGLGGSRPIGTFLLLGPTGVGKTETAKALAEALFFSDQAMTRIDLSEYGEAHAVARLIGAPPGYVGHDAGGQLTEAVRRRPYQVILLDELEKAHPEVLESFLALFDEGRMTDGRGRFVDFNNTVIVATSNLGVADLRSGRPLGFQSASSDGSGYREQLVARARAALAPELFNRIDEVLVYEPLDRSRVCQIAERMLARLAERVRTEREVTLEFSTSVVEHLLDAGGVDLALGARPMRRTISRLIEGPLAEMILRGETCVGARLVVRARNGEIVFETEGMSRKALARGVA